MLVTLFGTVREVTQGDNKSYVTLLPDDQRDMFQVTCVPAISFDKEDLNRRAQIEMDMKIGRWNKDGKSGLSLRVESFHVDYIEPRFDRQVISKRKGGEK